VGAEGGAAGAAGVGEQDDSAACTHARCGTPPDSSLTPTHLTHPCSHGLRGSDDYQIQKTFVKVYDAHQLAGVPWYAVLG
jgi:hypothetical protein